MAAAKQTAEAAAKTAKRAVEEAAAAKQAVEAAARNAAEEAAAKRAAEEAIANQAVEAAAMRTAEEASRHPPHPIPPLGCPFGEVGARYPPAEMVVTVEFNWVGVRKVVLLVICHVVLHKFWYLLNINNSLGGGGGFHPPFSFQMWEGMSPSAPWSSISRK